MSDRRPLASGDVLAHRYELQDLVSEKLGSTTWRAHDQILNRNVGIEMLSSSDPRAEHFLEAARESTSVTDPRFLRVLDLIEDEQRHHLVVREWARAFPLDQLLAQSPLPNRRAATVVAEVAEAIAHAHEHGVYHRRLTPHQVLLKESGAVRVVGLGVTTALSPVGRHDSLADLQAYEQLDVQALGKLLYACLVSRWPGAQVDGLRAAPTEHGRLLRPRQVRAGVARDVDTVADRILGSAAAPPRVPAAQCRRHRPHPPAVRARTRRCATTSPACRASPRPICCGSTPSSVRWGLRPDSNLHGAVPRRTSPLLRPRWSATSSVHGALPRAIVAWCCSVSASSC